MKFERQLTKRIRIADFSKLFIELIPKAEF